MKYNSLSLGLAVSFSGILSACGDLGTDPGYDPSLLLLETFSHSQPLGNRSPSFVSHQQIPDVGPTGYLRQWEPGIMKDGATEYSRMDFSAEGYLTANYSGIDGACSQDEVTYPIGKLMSPMHGTIELMYRPKYDNTDPSALMYLIDTKNNIDYPDSLHIEDLIMGTCYIGLGYYGWDGRKFFRLCIREQTSTDGFYDYGRFLVDINTPDEYSGNPTLFAKDTWMRIRIVWDGAGIPELGGRTAAIFIDGVLKASTSAPFSTQLEFDNWIVFGAQGAGQFQVGSYYKNYSGMSGDMDDISVFSTAIVPPK